MIVYTDGSRIEGPDGGSYAGIGIWFGTDDMRNSSIPVYAHNPTNQVAELLAIKYALVFCKDISDLIIKSDSQYSIKCVTEWCKTWMKNGWKTSGGKPVVNVEIIQSIIDMISERRERGLTTTFEHVYGHKGELGNEAADKLAVLASKTQMTVAMENTIYFYGHVLGRYSPLSQFHSSEFELEVDGELLKFNCVEQHHHYRKAILFGDWLSAKAIMESTDPGNQKRLGRRVMGFNNDVWMSNCYEYAKAGNTAKFKQNPSLKELLMSTRGMRIVEAAPGDPIWGIGLSVSEAESGAKWRGKNLLGKVLMEIRDSDYL